MKKRTEDAIQKALVHWLDENYRGIRVHATLNEDSRHKTAMGIDVGIPDLLIFWVIDGIEFIFYHELKTKTGTLKKAQKYWASKNAKASNNCYAVSYGFEEAKENCLKIIPVNFRAV